MVILNGFLILILSQRLVINVDKPMVTATTYENIIIINIDHLGPSYRRFVLLLKSTMVCNVHILIDLQFKARYYR